MMYSLCVGNLEELPETTADPCLYSSTCESKDNARDHDQKAAIWLIVVFGRGIRARLSLLYLKREEQVQKNIRPQSQSGCIRVCE